MQNNEQLEAKLDRMLFLLETYNEPNWHKYFKKAKSHLNKGRIKECKKQIIGAYGGMCSFNDDLYFDGASEEIIEEGYELRSELYDLCNDLGFFERLF